MRSKIIKSNIEEFLSSINCKYKLNEPLSKHTTLSIGGNADFFVEVETEQQLISLLKFINENKINFFVIGGGSNVLFGDDGFRGIIIKLSANSNGEFAKIKRLEDWEIGNKGYNDGAISLHDANSVVFSVGAAVSLSCSAKRTARLGLSGLEHFVAIPGTVAGALFGNAGIKNKDVSDALKGI